MTRLLEILGKFASHAKLLKSDPEQFGRNLSQFTNPVMFETRLLDIANAVPMNVRYDVDVGGPPTLNVLSSAWSASGMTGGPNTVINLACRVAKQGVAVRLVATVEPVTIDPAWFRKHAENLLGGGDFPDVSIVSATSAGPALRIGPRDVFLATHWTTAQQLKPVLQISPIKQFIYLIQDFEPGFYSLSSNFALAAETYGMDFWPIINEATLAEHLLTQPLGRMRDPEMRDRTVVFEPAVDEAVFHPAKIFPGSAAAPPRARRLLFYARPSNARNLFGLGMTALRRIASESAFSGWEFLSIGGRGGVPDLSLGDGRVIRPAPWKGYDDYGRLLREADILLCPMLSPHTSYPVLEMAACGGISVTNTFATKTADALHGISSNIIAVSPTIEGFCEGLLIGAGRVNSGEQRAGSINMPRDWATALDPVAAKVASILRNLAT